MMKILNHLIEEYRARLSDPEADLFFGRFDEPEGARILEVGAHDAPISSMLSASGFNVTGVDLRECDQTPNYEHVTGDIRMVRLTERFADSDQVGFIAFLRSDGNLLNAGVAPVKVLQH